MTKKRKSFSRFHMSKIHFDSTSYASISASTGTPVPITLGEALDPSFPGQGFPGHGNRGKFRNFHKGAGFFPISRKEFCRGFANFQKLGRAVTFC